MRYKIRCRFAAIEIIGGYRRDSAKQQIGNLQREARASNNIVIPNQRARWCGNLHRIPGSPSSYSLFYPTVSRNSSTRNCTPIREIATPVCALARNDREFGFGMTRSDDAPNSQFLVCCATAEITISIAAKRHRILYLISHISQLLPAYLISQTFSRPATIHKIYYIF